MRRSRSSPPNRAGHPIHRTQGRSYVRIVVGYLYCDRDGRPTPSVLWFDLGPNNIWFAMDGETSSTFTVTTTTEGSSTQYKAVFTNAAGSATTNLVWLYQVNYQATWSGYVVQALRKHFFTAVSGSWTVPTPVYPSTSQTQTVQWVGIDGWGNATVERDGTRADCYGGVAHYNAWYEMYGNPAVSGRDGIGLDVSSYPLRPGGEMNASVVFTTLWTFTINDVTAGWLFTTTEADPTPSTARATAEWIVEAPDNGADPLTPATPITFTNASATLDDGTSGSISSSVFIAQADGTDSTSGPADYVSPYSPDGTSFTISDTPIAA